MSTPITNPSPKRRFMASAQNVTSHRDMIATREFERGSDFAMLQYQWTVNAGMTDTQSALAAAYKLQGANEFLQTMKLLGETPRMPAPVIDQQNLDHKV